jgi:hypothetical protein
LNEYTLQLKTNNLSGLSENGRNVRFTFHFIHQMASRENQSGNVAPLKNITIQVVTKKLPNVVLVGLTTKKKLFDMNGGRQDQMKPMPQIWKKNEYVRANTDFGPRSLLANAFSPNFDLSCQKAIVGRDSNAANTAQPATKKLFFSTAWKDVPVSDSNAVNSISQFMFDGESSSDDEDLE